MIFGTPKQNTGNIITEASHGMHMIVKSVPSAFDSLVVSGLNTLASLSSHCTFKFLILWQ